MILAFSALAGASTSARCSLLDPFGIGDRRLGHGEVLDFEHLGVRLALAPLAELVRLGLLDLQPGVRWRRSSACDVFSPSMAVGVGLGDRDTHLALGVLDLRLPLERQPACSPTVWSLSSSATRTACRARPRGCRSTVPCRRWRPESPCRARPRRRGFAHSRSPATSPRACWIASDAAFWPIASM